MACRLSRPCTADPPAPKVHRLFNSGRYADALSVAEQQLRLLGESYGHSHLQGASRLSGTRPRRVRGPTRHNHHEYATAMNNVATLYQALGRYGEAEPLLEQASKIQQRTLGERRPRCASSGVSFSLAGALL